MITQCKEESRANAMRFAAAASVDFERAAIAKKRGEFDLAHSFTSAGLAALDVALSYKKAMQESAS